MWSAQPMPQSTIMATIFNASLIVDAYAPRARLPSPHLKKVIAWGTGVPKLAHNFFFRPWDRGRSIPRAGKPPGSYFQPGELERRGKNFDGVGVETKFHGVMC